MQAHRLGVLHRKLAKPADPGDGDPLAGLRLGLLDALVAGDAGTKDRPHFCEIAFLRQSPRPRAAMTPAPSWPGINGKRRPARPITVSGMEVCVTDAGRYDLNQDFAWARRGNWHLLDRQRLSNRAWSKSKASRATRARLARWIMPAGSRSFCL